MEHLSREVLADVPNAFQMNFFDQGHQRGPRVPRPRNRPRGAPDLDILFDAQEDMYKVDALFRELQQEIAQLDNNTDALRVLQKIQHKNRDGTRLIRRYLDMHGSSGMFQQPT